MSNTKIKFLSTLFLAGFMFISSCKKEKVAPPVSNTTTATTSPNNDTTAPPALNPSLKMHYGSPFVTEDSATCSNAALSNGSSWTITASNNNVNVSVCFDNGNVGAHTVLTNAQTSITAGSYTYNQPVSVISGMYGSYPDTFSVVHITENNAAQKYISGSFTLYLRSSSSYDTLVVHQGEFTQLSYQ